MKRIINDIFKRETEIKSFFKKNKENKEKKNYINQMKSIMKKWFPNGFKYNYCEELLEDQGYEAGLTSYFYILYKNKLYRYKNRFYNGKVCNIKLTRIYIINSPYYTEIYYNNNYIMVHLFKYDSYKKLQIILSKDIKDKILEQYSYSDNVWQHILKIINININIYYTGIYEYYIIMYEHISDNNYIYYYKKQRCKNNNLITSYKNFRLFKLFI